MSEVDLKIETEDEGSEREPEKEGKKNSLQNFVNEFFANPKKRLIFIIAIGVIAIGLFGTGIYFLTQDKATTLLKNNDDAKAGTENETKTALFQAPLDGKMVTKEASERHPLAVIVENHTDARPQSGLDKASIVYEALAEGGITRFMALFGTEEAEKVGPVRSARTYFVDWTHGYSAFFAHVGGNIDALEQINKEKVFDLDQMAYGEPTFWRERIANLATEHTMYTSTIKLREIATKAGYSKANNFSVYKYKDEPSETEKVTIPETQKITVNFSNPRYNVYFQYDKATNSYKRFLAGTAHNDNITKNQITPKEIVVMTVKSQPTITKINEQGLNMTTIGTGKAKIFLDGKSIDGSWKKDSKADREIFLDGNGKEISFNRGQLWICVVPEDVTPIVE